MLNGRKDMIVFWLVLIVTGTSGGNFYNAYTPSVMHVGNFSSYTDCERFGKSFTTPVQNNQNSPPGITMLCIQANQSGTNPPQAQMGERRGDSQ
jgi:hypothetical protein